MCDARPPTHLALARPPLHTYKMYVAFLMFSKIRMRLLVLGDIIACPVRNVY